MTWFKREKPAVHTDKKRDTPEGLWWKCDNCSATIHLKQLEDNLYTCPECGNHFRIAPQKYFECLFDNAQFTEFDTALRSADPLAFVDTKRYNDRIVATIKNTGLSDACRNAYGNSTVVGEKVARAIDKSLELKAPLLVISQSGGARMMEAALSLMQMAKTSARLTRLHKAGIPYISLLTDPTTGGVTASFAMLGDFNLAEPNALIGFAGPRVIKETIRRDLPEGFQRAEFLENHGFIDFIVDRKELKPKLAQLLNLVC
jgi:acetyl-CoA carboxylase carboxyl transferase subunit beta